ncbi:Rab GTPase activator and protein kinase, putative [Plasmodium gallinaceum]|uniref:Rab GTPase activator and protein kinase, putative n=1 Tax=Plasmodium gallinaceum TaxID=5849 RepID=A0A1J1GTR4_PLAGA|nr:Rab GTPase activator and protein kinase, putative [Plasmodium gallinaceum]CRG94435.1 Rab GTPase activator and protein kinase, putative [Plasmodium gallinaceum]
MYFKYCKSSEFLLGIQNYSLNKNEQTNKKRRSYNKINEKYYLENEYNLIACKFEKIKNLNHPNICRYLNLKRKNNNYTIFSEYYSISLYDILNEEKINYTKFNCLKKLSKSNNFKYSNTINNKIIDSKILNKIIYEILSAVQYLHDQKIKFLNLNTNNILITPKGKVKLHSYCISYLFNNHIYPNEKNDFFKNKLINEIISSKKYQNKLIDYNIKDYHLEEFVKKNAEYNRTKNQNNKDNFLSIENYFNYFDFTDDILYYLPLFIFLNILKNEKISLKYDLYKHIDIFSVGIIILQIVNGLLNFTFIIENFSYFINMKKINNLKGKSNDNTMGNNKKKNSKKKLIKSLPYFDYSNKNIKERKRNNCKNDNNYEYNYNDNYYDKNFNEKKMKKIYNMIHILKKLVTEKKKNIINNVPKKNELTNKEKGEGKKNQMFFFKSYFEKKDILSKVQNIFILLLYIKIYFIYIYNQKKENNKNEISLININIYNTFEKLCKEKFKNKKNHYISISYKIIKRTIENLINYKINVHFIKIIESMYSEFFTISLLKISLRNVFLYEKNNEKIFFINFLHKCLLLNFSKINISSLLSHYYFFYNDNVVKNNRFSSNSNKNSYLIINGLNLSNNNHINLMKEEKNNENINSNKKKYCKYDYYNPYITDYILSVKNYNELKSKYYINKKNIYYWFNLLYNINYNEELMNCNFFLKSQNILKIPFLIYKKKQKFYHLSLFSFYKLNLINKYYDLYSVYEYLSKEKKIVKRIKFEKEDINVCKQIRDNKKLYERYININSYKLLKKRHNIKKIINQMITKSNSKLKRNENKTKEKINKVKESYEQVKNDTEVSTLSDEIRFSNNYKNEKIEHFNFFNISFISKNSCLLFKDYNIKTFGIHLNEFYDIIKDAYLFISNNKNLSCKCVYKKNSFFIYEYNLYLKFQEFLKCHPLNNIELYQQLKNEFPICLRDIMYLIFLNYNYSILIKKSIEKKEKIKTLINIINKENFVNINSFNKNVYSNYNDSENKILNIKNSIKKKDYLKNINNINESKNSINDMNNNKEYLNKIGINKNTSSKCFKILRKKLKCNNDLVGSIKFQKKIYDLLLLIKFKLDIKNKYLKYLLTPITLLYYNNIYLAYKCIKQIIKIYLLELYKNKYYFNEYFYIFNCLLNYYIPELSIFFFKNNINITNLIRSWVCSLFCNFFDLENIYLLLDKILILPSSYIFFVCISILLYLKKFIMNTCCNDFYKKIFSLSNIVDLNFVLNNSIEIFNKTHTMYITFPSYSESNEEFLNNKDIKKYNSINYLSYIIKHKFWFNYYVHKDTFKIYKKIKKKKKSENIKDFYNGENLISENVRDFDNGENLIRENVRDFDNGKNLISDNEFLIHEDSHLINNEFNIITNNVGANIKLKRKSFSTMNADFINKKTKIKFLKLKGEYIEKKDTKNYNKILRNDKWSLKHNNIKSLKLKYYEYFLKCYKENKKNNLNEFICHNKNELKNSIQKKNKNNNKNKNKNTLDIYYDFKNKKSFKNIDAIKLNCFPILPFFYAKNLLNDLLFDNFIFVDMRLPECYNKKHLKYSIHINTFLTNFKKGFYNNYIDDYNVNINLKTIVLIFHDSVFDFDSIYNFLNLKIKFITILHGGFEHALNKLPSNYFT